MRGSKGQIGAVSPTYIDNADDWFRIVPEGVNVVFATLGVEEHTPEEFHKARQAVEQAARGLIKMGVGALVLGGSPLVTLAPGEGAGDLAPELEKRPASRPPPASTPPRRRSPRSALKNCCSSRPINRA